MRVECCSLNTVFGVEQVVLTLAAPLVLAAPVLSCRGARRDDVTLRDTPWRADGDDLLGQHVQARRHRDG